MRCNDLTKEKKILLELNTNCNANCIYCYHASNKTIYNTKIEDFLIPESFLKDWNFTSLVITGGEPLLDMFRLGKILHYYKDKIRSIEILTNGLLLDKTLIKQLIKIGVNGFSISCDGIIDSTQFFLRNIKTEQIWEIIKETKKEVNDNTFVNILYTLTSINSSKKNIKDFVNKVKEIGLLGIKFQPVTMDLLPEKKYLEIKSTKQKELIEWIKTYKEKWSVVNSEQFFEISSELGSEKKYSKKINCNVPDQSIFINAKGFLQKCPILTQNQKVKSERTLMNWKFEIINCNVKNHCLCLF